MKACNRKKGIYTAQKFFYRQVKLKKGNLYRQTVSYTVKGLNRRKKYSMNKVYKK